MRIAMIGQKRIPSREGGIEVVVEELAVRMVQSGHEVVCYNRKGHHVAGSEFDNKKRMEYKGVKLKEVFTIDKKGLAAMTSSFFAAMTSLFGRFDVIHFHAEGPCAMLWIPHMLGIRTVATIHGLDHQRAKWSGFASKYLLLGEKTAVKYADEIIVLSENVKDYFKNTYGRETVYIPNGIRKPILRECRVIEEKWGLHQNEYVLFLGRLVPEKGIKYLLQAYKELQTDKKLVIAGGSSDSTEFMQELWRMAEGDDRILFTGFVQGETLEELYSNAYVYVLPSDLEGMPMGLLEAMSYGNCCLTSDIAECVEVVADRAAVFRKSDVDDLREKLQMLCDDEKLVQDYKSGAADFICEKYSWDDIVQRTVELYR